MRTLDLIQLQTFYRVARLMNFSRAAEELSLSQSTVSRHIEALEREYGMELFARAGRGAALTEAGVRLLDYAERILHLNTEAARALAELKSLDSGHLAVGASTTPGNYLLGPVVAAYQERYPGIQLRLDIGDSQSVLRLVEQDVVDVAVLALPADASGLKIEPCVEDELVLVAAAGHPLASRPVVTLAELTGTRFFVREPGSHTRLTVESHFQARAFQPHPVSELGSTEAIKRVVTAGGGVAFLSRFAVAPEIRAGLLASPGGPECRIRRQFVLAYPKGQRRAPAVLAFTALMRKMRADLEGDAAQPPGR